MSTPSLMDLIKSKKAALNAGKRQKTLKPKDGRNRYRILPSWRLKLEGGALTGDPTFYHDFGQHFIKDEAGDMKAVYICTDKTFGKPCGVCATIDAAIRSTSDDAMVKLMKEAKAAGRILLNVLEVDGENPNDPGILELAPTAFNEVLNIFAEWGDITDLAEGKDIIVERSGKGIGTRYSVQIASKSKPVTTDTWKKVANLDEYVAQESEEQAARAITNVKSVAGLLPSEHVPRAAAPKAKPAPALTHDDEHDATDDIPMTTSEAAAVVEEVTSTGDADLDALLADLT
jgi:hypothetical protein